MKKRELLLMFQKVLECTKEILLYLGGIFMKYKTSAAGSWKKLKNNSLAWICILTDLLFNITKNDRLHGSTVSRKCRKGSESSTWIGRIYERYKKNTII